MRGRTELSDFLRTRRDRLHPADVGLTPLGRRRAPGLRRSEVAHLAGISVDYYIRLEQGRRANPSAAVLNALSRILGLAADEREHLFELAGFAPPADAPTGQVRVRASVRHLLASLRHSTPAFVLGRGLQVLAWNELAAALITDFAACPPAERNIVRHGFCDPAARTLYADWPGMARRELAHLRVAIGRHPNDPQLASLVRELTAASREFREWWHDHDVMKRGHGRKELNHPLVGRLVLDYEAFTVPGVTDQHLVTYTAEPGSRSEAALQRLAAISARRR